MGWVMAMRGSASGSSRCDSQPPLPASEQK